MKGTEGISAQVTRRISRSSLGPWPTEGIKVWIGPFFLSLITMIALVFSQRFTWLSDKKGAANMPTVFTHAFIPLGLGKTATDKKLPLKFWLLGVLCSVLPDADVIGFKFGIAYGDFWGHRGFFHSIFFAFLLSTAIIFLAFRKLRIFSKQWWLSWLFFFIVSSSHGILDTFTNGGLGIALLSPFNTTR